MKTFGQRGLVMLMGVAVVCIVATLVVVAANLAMPAGDGHKTVLPATKQAPAQAELLFAGDIVFHPITYSPQYETVVQPYDFSHMFARMADHLKAADFASITFETVCDPDMPYAGYPVFNTPEIAIPTLKKAGFDAFATASNHCLDGAGISSHDKTLRAMDRHHMDHFGTRLPDAPPSPYIKEVKGIKIACLNYAEMYNDNEAALSDADLARLSHLELAAVCRDIAKAKKSGADLIAVFPHWGIEYQTRPSEAQIALAHEIAAAGADLVIGSHPHVINPAEWVDNQGRKSFIAYSLGNAMSNQRAEFLGTIDTEIGCFLRVKVKKTATGTQITEASLLPSTVYVNHKAGGKKYEAGLIKDFLASNELTPDERAHMQRLQERAEAILAQTVGE